LASFFFDLVGGITGANDAFLDMIGFSREELETGQIRYENLMLAEWRWRFGGCQRHVLEAHGVDQTRYRKRRPQLAQDDTTGMDC
jgi:PAS domain-containing protein